MRRFYNWFVTSIAVALLLTLTGGAAKAKSQRDDLSPLSQTKAAAALDLDKNFVAIESNLAFEKIDKKDRDEEKEVRKGKKKKHEDEDEKEIKKSKGKKGKHKADDDDEDDDREKKAKKGKKTRAQGRR